MRVFNEKLLDEFRARGRCEICNAWRNRRFPHHWYARGMANGSRLDIRENVIGLCLACHEKCHNCKIDRAYTLEIIAQRERKTPQECKEVIWNTLARKKETPRVHD